MTAEQRRNLIGGAPISEDGEDNLTIALATYFSDHMDRPDDDPEDTELGWGVWVIGRTNKALDIIAAELWTAPDKIPSTKQ